MTQTQQRLSEQIQEEARLTEPYTGIGRFSDRTMHAMAHTPREEFVSEGYISLAYENRPLPIGYGQTISQPYIVALMTELLELEGQDIVLEIGTGSGYQAAVLSHLAKAVYTVERVPELAEAASMRFKALGYNNIHSRESDGYEGWVEEAPFDAIIVTAAARDVPQVLVEQLKPGGRMVLPVGLPHASQELMLLRKDNNGKVNKKTILAVAFVPMIGG